MVKKFAAGLVALAVAFGLAGAAPAQAAPALAVPIAARPAKPQFAPPQKPVARSGGGFSTLAGPYYSYAIAEDNQAATGMMADVDIERPWLSSADSHTLWEMAMCDHKTDGSQRNCFEMGWVIDNTQTASINGTDTVNPHLFTSHWKDGKFQGWNTAQPGYNDYLSNTTIWTGISLNGAVGGVRHMRMQYFQDKVWFGYGTGPGGSTWFEWVGYVDVSGWGALKPTTFDQNQWFGEVASTTRAAPSMCTDMLKNVTPTTTTGHLTTGVGLDNNAVPEDVSVRTAPTGITGRGAVKVSSTSARLGGPGPC